MDELARQARRDPELLDLIHFCASRRIRDARILMEGLGQPVGRGVQLKQDITGLLEQWARTKGDLGWLIVQNYEQYGWVSPEFRVEKIIWEHIVWKYSN